MRRQYEAIVPNTADRIAQTAGSDASGKAAVEPRSSTLTATAIARGVTATQALARNSETVLG